MCPNPTIGLYYVSGSRVRAVLCVPGSNVLDTSGSHIRSRLITWTMDDVSGPNVRAVLCTWIPFQSWTVYLDPM